ncbi:MAG: phosphotransferase [Gammaproteobacteria bacterium]|nr:phosphotransferase [Gammaproteobacteria bacterium]
MKRGKTIHSSDSIVDAIDKAVSFKCSFAKTLKENQNLILSMNNNYLAVIPILLEDTVVTHGDLNQFNVLWDKTEQPILIDWESARKLNPTREIVRASLGWSGTADSSLSIYTRMLRTYIKSGGTINPNHIHAAFYSSIGSMVFWMLYNIEITCTSDATEAKDIAIKEVNGVMMAMTQFNILVPDLISKTNHLI